MLQNFNLKLEMNRNILVLICLILIEEELAFTPSSNREIIFLPMKKDHKYGDDICYYREIDEKLDYAVYYVKPCEKGKYCEDNVNFQPFGFCKDIPTNITDIPNYGDTCTTNAECQDDLICENTCKYQCPSSSTPFQHDYDSFSCHGSSYEIIEDKYCKKTDNIFSNVYPQRYTSQQTYYGKFPGLPKKCGIIRYDKFTDYSAIPGSSPIAYKSFTRYLEVSREWCSIGEAQDGDFVDDWRFCKSGFVLPFYPNKDIVNPEEDYYTLAAQDMCVTPIAIDINHPLFRCVITYKLEDGSEHKYKVSSDSNSLTNSASQSCNANIVIKSQLYTEFINEFNSASEEDKKNCYRIPQGTVGNCENIKLLKLYYFYSHINEYLFYKDRKDLEKVLHFKIQQAYHRYYELSRYLNLNYLFFLLILILL